MVNEYRCPCCRETVFLRKYLDGKYYVWFETRKDEHEQSGQPFDDREELTKLYKENPSRFRKVNWVQESLSGI
jgi:hypothetical protein